MTDTLAKVACDGCGQVDDHPKIHVASSNWRTERDGRAVIIPEPSFHADCLPQEFRAQLVGPSHAVTNAMIEKAEAGTHGAKLREFIATQPSDNDTQEG